MLPTIPVTMTAARALNRCTLLPRGCWSATFTGPASLRAFTWGCRWCSNRADRDGEAGGCVHLHDGLAGQRGACVHVLLPGPADEPDDQDDDEDDDQDPAEGQEHG